MTTPLDLTCSSRPDGTVVLAVAGEVDMTNSDRLAAAADRALSGGPGPLVVDLSAVAYLDSAGLKELLIRADRIEIVAADILAPVLTICGLTELTTVHGLEPPGHPDGDGSTGPARPPS
ncbi:STAS domain-containing protein [Actinacidiphila paucisporea]|uniref:Anti-anti-sigma factor n=1 Tax=Actinacidiphila paucisporea TaxID=310782 RepID=A0A1M7FUG6_9ACTN|nr:STAS domain-containing protein [Actinacidiphila paucisporea]SHM07327.1 anti-anti-sigma factor [Actinacidiphila paucisporea]